MVEMKFGHRRGHSIYLLGGHEWICACQTPSGGDAGGEDVFVCTHCGKESIDIEKEDRCKTPENDATCPRCFPHPKHEGKCVFACPCTTSVKKVKK